MKTAGYWGSDLTPIIDSRLRWSAWTALIICRSYFHKHSHRNIVSHFFKSDFFLLKVSFWWISIFIMWYQCAEGLGHVDHVQNRYMSKKLMLIGLTTHFSYLKGFFQNFRIKRTSGSRFLKMFKERTVLVKEPVKDQWLRVGFWPGFWNF